MSEQRRHRAPRPRTAQAPSQRARRADPARDTAYRVMRAVAEGAYANLELPQQLRAARLSGRDAAFATELTYGGIRMQGLYDAVVAVAADRTGSAIDPQVRDILRLGCHQLLAMRVPDHAAVSATVALAREHVGAGAGGFVNAVLRRVSERNSDQWIEATTAGLDPVEALAVQYSHPPWIVRALRAALIGHDAADPQQIDSVLVALLTAHNTASAVTLVARPGLVTDEELTSVATPDPAAPTAWTLTGGDPGATAAVREHRAGVQDAGSQLAALALAGAPVEGDRGRWLDLCAGPGGKAALLGAVALGRGAALVANEVSATRARLVAQAVEPLLARGARVDLRVGDGRQLGEADPESYDRVLVDAPCTGLGALRRRPEARWRRSPADLATLGPLQRALLSSALEAVRPGGVVAYVTCSPHLAETRFVVKDVLRSRPDITVEDARPLLTDRAGRPLADTGPGPWAQLWPHVHGTDAMFIALLRRDADRSA